MLSFWLPYARWSVSDGRNPRGANHGMAKLSAENVKEIKKMISETSTPFCEIAKMFSISESVINGINREVIWVDKSSDFKPRRRFNVLDVLSKEDAEAICKLLDDGVKQKDIAEMFGVDRRRISDIKTGKLKR